jgi:tRNA threonylcarbamoyladenosine biosynthesis protein TsaB
MAMNLLAIDTSTECGSVALAVQGQVLQRSAVLPRQHAEQLLPWIDELLAEGGLGRTQIDAIAVGRGPGGFTGVRLAVAVAQGLAWALQRPLLAVSSLAALAMQADRAPGDRVLAAIDARMGELYLGRFRIDPDGLAVAMGVEWMATPDAVELPDQGWWGVGSGFAAADGLLARRLASQLQAVAVQRYPQAGAILRLALPLLARGEITLPEHLEPAYLRDKVAQTLAERGR